MRNLLGKYSKPKVIYVDVDGTLLIGKPAKPNLKLLGFLDVKKSEGFELVLWSTQGKAHAENAARLCGREDLFAHILSKPGYIIDDKGWTWARFTARMRVH